VNSLNLGGGIRRPAWRLDSTPEDHKIDGLYLFGAQLCDGKGREQNARNQPCDSCQCYLFMF